MPEITRIAGFDLETTGIDVYSDRIVTAYIAIFDAEGNILEDWSWLLDPEIEIPEGASNVHGVTTERARAEGSDYATGVFDIVQRLNIIDRAGIPVSGMNLSYDLTLLREQFAERFPGAKFDAPHVVLDAYVIDKKIDKYRKGKRNLVSIAPVYGVEASANAHDADADVVMAARIVLAQLKHPWLAPLTLEQIHERQIKNAAEQAATLEAYFHESGKMPLDEHIDGGWPLKAECR